MKALSMKLPEPLAARLAAAARRRGKSKSALARDFLEQGLTNAEIQTQPSALDLAGDLVGCFKGPRDLSSNPKHMEGFGQ